MIERELFFEKLSGAACLNGFSQLVGKREAELLYNLTVRMLEVNEHMNLTAICDLDGIILKHYIDSITVSPYIPENSTVIDVGCGAGFPSLPLAIIRPDLKITALDSTAKRIDYIRETTALLGLSNISCKVGRAEELSHDKGFREAFDVAVARAVARLNILSELCIPFVKIGGAFVAMKANAEEEAMEAISAIQSLGGQLVCTDEIALMCENSVEENKRCIIKVEKISQTPKNYPRNNSQIKKKPL